MYTSWLRVITSNIKEHTIKLINAQLAKVEHTPTEQVTRHNIVLSDLHITSSSSSTWTLETCTEFKLELYQQIHLQDLWVNWRYPVCQRPPCKMIDASRTDDKVRLYRRVLVCACMCVCDHGSGDYCSRNYHRRVIPLQKCPNSDHLI